MKFRLTKTNAIVTILSIVVLTGALAFLVWRVNQMDTIGPTEGEAGGGAGSCCELGVGCIAGYKCVSQDCSESEGAIPCTAGADGCDSCGTGYRCRILPNSESVCIDEYAHKCEVTSAGTCVADAPDEPPSEGDCKGTICEWPAVVMSGRNDPSEAICRCERCTGRDSSDPWSCSGNPPTCKPGSCPSGYESCGTSVSHESSGSCVKKSSIRCVVHHPDCNNPSYIFRYCKPVGTEQTCGNGVIDAGEQCDPNATPTGCASGSQCTSSCTCSQATNVCDGGSWINMPSGNINFNTDISFSAKAEDSDGIQESSITSKLCEGTITKCTSGQAIDFNITNTTATATSFTGVLSDSTNRLSPGDYTLSVDWADSKGATSTVCALTTSFTILSEDTNPDWDISKSVAEQCIDDNTEDPVAKLTYTITVENTGDGAGQISKVEDSLDSKVLAAGLVPSNITTPGVYSAGKIVWDYTSPPLSIPAGSTKTYTYVIEVDKDNFGIYNNTVTLTPVGSADIQASASIEADCNIIEPDEPVPQTGIFDTTLSRVVGGIILLLIGGIVYNLPNGIFSMQAKKPSYKYRARFEKRVDNK